MATKITRISRKGDMVKIGNTVDDSKWYRLAQPVQTFMKKSNIAVDSEVTFEVGEVDEKNVGTINRISANGASAGNGASATPTTTNRTRSYQSNGDSSNKDESIRRQTVIKAVGEALVALQGQVDLNNVTDVSTTLFNHFLALVNGENK